MDKPVRVRFAPSPTGRPHVGNIRTAIFNYLMARHFNGSFILRIEDTDQTRKVEGAMEYMMDALHWLGMDWDEGPDKGGDHGPYYQSQRLHLYKEAAERLVAEGKAYPCYCSAERLEAMRKEQAANKQPPGYDRACRNLTPEERKAKEAEGITPVIRFAIPLDGKTTFTDLIYGEVSFDHANIDDFVMLKSDGYPTYHLANVVDDHAMEVSHVIRAEEWISSTPRHILLYKALGYEPPQFVHHPLIVGPDRAKLSKRHGSVSILDYREQGYLPETMLNFLSLIGWSLDDKTEIMSKQELIEYFSLDRIGKTGAVFNRDKLDWMNGVYIRNLDVADFTERAVPFVEAELPEDIERPLDRDYLAHIMPLVQERTKKLTEVADQVAFFFRDTLDYDPLTLVAKKMDGPGTLHVLEATLPKLEALPNFDEESLENLLRPYAEELGVKAGQLFSILRTAVSGETATPPLFQMMVVLGRDRCLARTKEAIEKLRAAL